MTYDFSLFHFFQFSKQLTVERDKNWQDENFAKFSFSFLAIYWNFWRFFKVSQKQRFGLAGQLWLECLKKVKQIFIVIVKRKKLEVLLLFCLW